MPTTFKIRRDPKNANRGTDRGRALLKESIQECGLGRSIVTDKHGTIIGGNHTFEAAGAVETEVVETTGHELVVVQREDLDLASDVKARKLAIADNRVGEVNLAWSKPEIQADVLAGVDLSPAFFPEEVAVILAAQEPQALPDPAVDVSVGGGGGSSPGGTSRGGGASRSAAPVAGGSFTLTFNTVQQQQKWDAFRQALAARYPDLTAAAALAAHLSTCGIA